MQIQNCISTLLVFRTALLVKQLESVILIWMFCCLWYQFVPHSACQTQSVKFQLWGCFQGNSIVIITTVIEVDRNFNKSQYLRQLQAELLSADECHQAKQKTIGLYFAWILDWKFHNYNIDGHRAHYTAGLYTVYKPFNNVYCVYYSKVCVCVFVNISMISSLIKSIDHHSADFKSEAIQPSAVSHCRCNRGEESQRQSEWAVMCWGRREEQDATICYPHVDPIAVT